MVTTEPGAGNTAAEPPEGGTTFGKLRQTLSSSLLTAQDKVTKMNPRPSLIPDLQEVTPPSEEKPPMEPPPTNQQTAATNVNKPEPGKPPSRAGACRVCLKAFKPEDFSRTCAECTQRVCEDCASYSKLAENEDPANWTCSVCRRKLQSRAAMAQDSNESLLEIPIQELQRRHSEARLGSGGGLSAGGGVGSGLAPPRSPELRRHSDVSPASLKELEKNPDPDWSRSRGGRSQASSRQNSPPRETTAAPIAPRSRRASRVARQHSYDEEVKSGAAPANNVDNGLALPPPMPRRASAYDVFSVPGLSTVTAPAGVGRRASFRIAAQEPSSPPSPETGSPAVLVAPEEDRRTRRRGSHLQGFSTATAFATVTQDIVEGFDKGMISTLVLLDFSKAFDTINHELICMTRKYYGFDSGALSLICSCSLGRSQKVVVDGHHSLPLDIISGVPQGSLLNNIRDNFKPFWVTFCFFFRPDIVGLRPLAAPRPTPALEDLEAVPRRQASVDAEAIRIVIHDVDSGTAAAAQKRVVLRRDPTDKAHRTRGFGMRVVGGKTAPDGRLFAYIVWTVPGGPAEKGGLQQGDKVLEWSGVSLIDRSFEEVCSIMDRTGDMVELLVEHATDLRMCDLLDDPIPPSSSLVTRKPSEAGIAALHIEPDGDKAPSSPTRRKLPKTPV
ncbi:regulating synaptic membrane exocytosis protein fife [Leptinotarsa decemlineata]|uniref:regulating synaptic membrane exocytosis protein fife n=1 Tax=Leptinotarsa decemlineata TaxID=7539 RepID=UPI003D3079C7